METNIMGEMYDAVKNAGYDITTMSPDEIAETYIELTGGDETVEDVVEDMAEEIKDAAEEVQKGTQEEVSEEPVEETSETQETAEEEQVSEEVDYIEVVKQNKELVIEFLKSKGLM